jgi:hypothetical protein
MMPFYNRQQLFNILDAAQLRAGVHVAAVPHATPYCKASFKLLPPG